MIFQTVRVNVQLRDSQGRLMDGGKVQYYSGGGWDFGLTSGGIAEKELLPANYKFRATSGKVQVEKSPEVSVNPMVELNVNL